MIGKRLIRAVLTLGLVACVSSVGTALVLDGDGAPASAELRLEAARTSAYLRTAGEPELRLAELASEAARTRSFLRTVQKARELVALVDAAIAAAEADRARPAPQAPRSAEAGAARIPAPASSSSSSASSSDEEFLACTRAHESDSAGGYSATDHGDGGEENMGAYQFSQSTWNAVAARTGRADLVGVRPDQASPADQDALALELYHEAGNDPWEDRC